METIIASFVTEIANGQIEIYNEFSLQHEFGIYLRNAYPNKKTQFERNVSYFGLDKRDFVKKEIDISIFKDKYCPLTAIELKYPRNGQHPEQMYKFCQDVLFAEQLIKSGFRNAHAIIFAEDHLFYEGECEGIYGVFRGGSDITGRIKKPTGRKDTEVNIGGCYAVDWKTVRGSLKYAIITVRVNASSNIGPRA